MPTKLTATSECDLPAFVGLNGSPIHPSGVDRDSQAGRGDGALGELTYLTADNRDLRAEVERLRAERDRLLGTQARIMELLGTAVPERLVHDLRNVLNERELFKALADTVE